jgi:hypothetical protein
MTDAPSNVGLTIEKGERAVDVALPLPPWLGASDSPGPLFAASENSVQLRGGRSLERWQHVRVRVERKADLRVPWWFHDCPRVHALRE